MESSEPVTMEPKQFERQMALDVLALANRIDDTIISIKCQVGHMEQGVVMKKVILEKVLECTLKLQEEVINACEQCRYAETAVYMESAEYYLASAKLDPLLNMSSEDVYGKVKESVDIDNA